MKNCTSTRTQVVSSWPPRTEKIHTITPAEPRGGRLRNWSTTSWDELNTNLFHLSGQRFAPRTGKLLTRFPRRWGPSPWRGERRDRCRCGRKRPQITLSMFQLKLLTIFLLFLNSIYPKIFRDFPRFLSTDWTSEKYERNLYFYFIWARSTWA